MRLGQEGQRFFQLRGEEPFGLEAGLQGLEGLGQGPQTQRLQVVHDHLVFAPGLVHRQAAPAEELAALLGLETHMLVITLKQDGAQLGPGVFEGEVIVPRQGLPEVGDLAAHPDQREMGLQALANLPGEAAHRIDVG